LNRIARMLITRATMAALLTLMAGEVVGRASVVQSTVILPPPNGVYTFGPMCLSSLDRCVENTIISDFVTTSDMESGGNELVTATATYLASVYTDNSGTPGSVLGDLSITGTIDVTYIGRDPSVNPLGTFTTNVTGFDFAGMLNGNSIVFEQNPTMMSTGSTTIHETSLSPVEYTVSSSIDLNGQYNFNNAGFMTAPERTATLTAVPEPESSALAASVLVMLGIKLRRYRVLYSHSRRPLT
jgi:hypothetical protein